MENACHSAFRIDASPREIHGNCTDRKMCGNRPESAIRDFDLRGDPQIQTWGEGLLILLAGD